MGREQYQGYVELCRLQGLPEDQIEAQLQEWEAEDVSLQAKKCPKCGISIQRELDPHQAGPSLVKGQWYKYWCKGCGYLATKVEFDSSMLS